jgi:hypothetical protein
MHRTRLNASDHPDGTLRRPRKQRLKLAAQRRQPPSGLTAEIHLDIGAIERHERVQLAAVERFEPVSDEIKRIHDHSVQMLHYSARILRLSTGDSL